MKPPPRFSGSWWPLTDSARCWLTACWPWLATDDVQMQADSGRLSTTVPLFDVGGPLSAANTTVVGRRAGSTSHAPSAGRREARSRKGVRSGASAGRAYRPGRGRWTGRPGARGTCAPRSCACTSRAAQAGEHEPHVGRLDRDQLLRPIRDRRRRPRTVRRSGGPAGRRRAGGLSRVRTAGEGAGGSAGNSFDQSMRTATQRTTARMTRFSISIVPAPAAPRQRGPGPGLYHPARTVGSARTARPPASRPATPRASRSPPPHRPSTTARTGSGPTARGGEAPPVQPDQQQQKPASYEVTASEPARPAPRARDRSPACPASAASGAPRRPGPRLGGNYRRRAEALAYPALDPVAGHRAARPCADGDAEATGARASANRSRGARRHARPRFWMRR